MKKTMKIEGMSCAHCSAAVTKALEAVEGVSEVSVSLDKKQATLQAEATVSDDTLRRAVEEEGYDVIEIA